MKKEIEKIASSFNKWCLRKNIIASKNENMPIVFIRDSAHCSYLEFELRRSKKRYSEDIEIDGYYQGKKSKLTIEYNKDINIKILKEKIKDFIIQYLKLKKEITTFKFRKINKACIDLIDDKDIYFDKKENVIIKSIISKIEVIDYKNNTYRIEDLYIRYI